MANPQSTDMNTKKARHDLAFFASGLSIGYGDKIIQHDLNLHAQAGQLVALLGQNGSGKSTLLRTLAGLQPALSGTFSTKALSPAQRAREMALVLTERLSLENTTVEEIVAMGRYPYTSLLGTLTATDLTVIHQALNQVDMFSYANHYFCNLSDGEQQRVLIAKALAQQTPLILLDEPTAHLDLPSRIKIMLLLQQLAHDENKCILISTHELDIALHTADTIWLMTQQGVRVGTPTSIRPYIIQEFGESITPFVNL